MAGIDMQPCLLLSCSREKKWLPGKSNCAQISSAAYSPHLHNPPDTSHRSISPTLITLGRGWEPQFVWHPSIFIKLEWTPSTSKNTQPSDRRKYLLWLRSSIVDYLCFWIVYLWPLQMFPIFWLCCAMDGVWMTGAPKYGDCSQNVCPSPPQP